ncbi:hypothetical protein GFS60_06875 (plasmid) [Rhodococcus sp. WAY2]|nr:hypothetical protein GFS60_06875 [Rhodococcus sp. WAY2]
MLDAAKVFAVQSVVSQKESADSDIIVTGCPPIAVSDSCRR